MMLYIWMPLGTEPWRYSNSQNPAHLTWETANNLDELLAAVTPSQKNANTDVIVFFPTSQAQIIQKPMNEKQFKKLGDAGLAYVLEEFTLLPTDQLQIRADHHKTADNDGLLSLIAMPLHVIQNYQQLLAIGPWHLQALVPDFLLLPHTPNAATLYIDEFKRLLRVDTSLGYDADDLEVILPRAMGNLQTLQVAGYPTEQDNAILIASELNLEHSTIQFNASGINANHPLNMLPRSKTTQLPPYWKAVIGVLIAAITVQISSDLISTYQNSHTSKIIRAQSENYFKQWFPTERPLAGSKLRDQIEAHLKSTDAKSYEVLTLMSRVGPILTQNNVFATTIIFQNSVLELTVTAPNMQSLDTLKTQLGDQGLNVSLEQANAKGSEATGTLRVQL